MILTWSKMSPVSDNPLPGGSTPGEALGYTSKDLTSLWTRCWQWSIGQCSPLLLSPSSIWVMTLIKSYDFYLSHVSLVWTMNVPYTTSWTCALFAKSHQIAIDQKHPPKKIWSPQPPELPLSRSPTPGPTHIGRKIWWPFRLLGSYLVALPSISTAMRWRGWARIWIESLFMEFVGCCQNYDAKIILNNLMMVEWYWIIRLYQIKILRLVTFINIRLLHIWPHHLKTGILEST